ncbi:hypothetical protein FHR22_002626 [Sphingopyxis panaciterrae]|uniref:hypothetical protein n=1 Tax=Sphingopyxis panaciterrae TaxID=363841 RepID=UPI0014229CD4|nr:hypothetical protein [Sphingopyxis panaciterrae]NIJ37923.1 hypothetical protein [Sphingopyxis panaciterrae]
MALGDRFIALVGLAQFDFPGRTVRLADGGVAKMDGELFHAKDEVFGALAEADPIDEAMGDALPDGGITLFIPQETALSVVMNPALQGCRVRFWHGELDMATGVATGEMLRDTLVDQVMWDPIERKLSLTLMGRTERLAVINRGNYACAAFHKSVYPGERGFDNCTDAQFQKAWGTAGAPRGVTSGSGGGGARNAADLMRGLR